MKPVEVIRLKERVEIVRMVVELNRISQAAHLPERKSLSEAAELLLIGAHTLLAQASGHPATISSLARATGIARKTVERRVQDCVSHDRLERAGRHVFMGAAFNKPVGGLNPMVERQIATVMSTAQKLAKLTNNPQLRS
jgi:response regulator of citrate/malate metabolism